MTTVFSSAKATQSVVEMSNQRAKWRDEGINVEHLFGMQSLDNYVKGLWPGDVCVTVALPNCGKSTTARIMLNRILASIMDANKRQVQRGEEPEKVCCVWVSTEETLQKIQGAMLASNSKNVTLNDILGGRISDLDKRDPAALIRASQLPLYIIANETYSGKRDDGQEFKRSPRLTKEEIWRGLEYVHNQGFRIAYVVVDYLQRIEQEDARKEFKAHMMECAAWTRDVAKGFGTVVHVLSQAKAAIRDRRHHLPGTLDIEWVHAMGEIADVILGIWMPKATLGVGAMTEAMGSIPATVITEDMLYVMVAKQREGKAGDVFITSLRPEEMLWEELQVTELPGPKEKEKTRARNAEIPF